MNPLLPLAMFLATFAVLLTGFPVAFCLAGTALIFAGIGLLTGHFDPAFLSALPSRTSPRSPSDTVLRRGSLRRDASVSSVESITMSMLWTGIRGTHPLEPSSLPGDSTWDCCENGAMARGRLEGSRMFQEGSVEASCRLL